ncbi:MAG: hypothetical protein ACFFCW_44000 [Candidatus Hodarchaeota archaeon]
MKSNPQISISVTMLSVVLLYPNQCYAYIDPGAGSMLLQALLAAVAAVSVSLGIFRRRLASLLRRLARREKTKRDDSDR